MNYSEYKYHIYYNNTYVGYDRYMEMINNVKKNGYSFNLSKWEIYRATAIREDYTIKESHFKESELYYKFNNKQIFLDKEKDLYLLIFNFKSPNIQEKYFKKSYNNNETYFEITNGIVININRYFLTKHEIISYNIFYLFKDWKEVWYFDIYSSLKNNIKCPKCESLFVYCGSHPSGWSCGDCKYKWEYLTKQKMIDFDTIELKDLKVVYEYKNDFKLEFEIGNISVDYFRLNRKFRKLKDYYKGRKTK
ncbi:hypothetical protein LCGC14_1267060 [marine sediment metagenome]|uniref:Uncharacterized protein n=1 Tax=marine sediment metagenome TaxID=412755 RepID=A0A0F9P2D1_9ZZZZ